MVKTIRLRGRQLEEWFRTDEKAKDVKVKSCFSCLKVGSTLNFWETDLGDPLGEGPARALHVSAEGNLVQKYILLPFYYISFPKTFFVALMYMYRTYSHEHGGKRIFPNALVSFWNRMPIVFIFLKKLL